MRRMSRRGLIALLSNDMKLPASMRLVECTDDRAILEGEFKVNAQQDGHPHIEEIVFLRIEVDSNFPEVLPKVINPDQRLPRSIDNHVYSDGSFCLGSELVLKYKLRHNPTIGTFLEECVEPFLYSVLHFLQYETFPYGELAHGMRGLIADYEDFLGVKGKEAVLSTISLLSMRKRIANKLPCPCRCGRRVGRCGLHRRLNYLRRMASRSWYSNYAKFFYTQS
ncbi:MAG: hypothetical protein CMQ38_00165 [Gammaproteobacteria bacterium]|nr:hypothetical protein [Gammaproteobacteria bacterium]